MSRMPSPDLLVQWYQIVCRSTDMCTKADKPVSLKARCFSLGTFIITEKSSECDFNNKYDDDTCYLFRIIRWKIIEWWQNMCLSTLHLTVAACVDVMGSGLSLVDYDAIRYWIYLKFLWSTKLVWKVQNHRWQNSYCWCLMCRHWFHFIVRASGLVSLVSPLPMKPGDYRFPRRLSVCPSVCLSVCPSVRPSVRQSVSPLGFPNFSQSSFEILTWNLIYGFVFIYTDQVWLWSRFTYFYMRYCPLQKLFSGLFLSSLDILSWNFIYEFVLT